MPLYDYECACCGIELEQMVPMAVRHSARCPTCSGSLNLVFRPTPRYVPFHPYFDIGLGVDVTGRDFRRRYMRDHALEHRDPPRPGDRSARFDRINEARKREGRTTVDLTRR